MQLILIRGLPGSGKSTLARTMTTYEHYEADMYFVRGDKYCYDHKKIRKAHEWCQREVFKALTNGKSVVVSNTFTRRFEMKPYLDMAKIFGIKPCIIETTGNWPNVHEVPQKVIEKMRQRWQQNPNIE